MVSKHCRSSGHIGYTRLWMRFQPMNAGFFKGLLIVFLLFPACLHAVVSITPVCSFYSTNGSFPTCALVQGGDGNFYGTTRYGGPVGYGTVFKIAADGTLATVNSFYGTNGANPAGTLVFGKDGNLYGTTPFGGSMGYGTVFRISTDGALTTLVSFDLGTGANPVAGLVQGNDGNFYGTTRSGGVHYAGTVFRISPGGELTSLYSFGSVVDLNGRRVDGVNPAAALVQGADGNFYGTTYTGGSNVNSRGTSTLGTIFKISPSGALTTVYSFGNQIDSSNHILDGAFPQAALIQGSDGNLYGTTSQGGFSGFGTVFKIGTNGVFTSLAALDGNDGLSASKLIQGRDGNLYGTSSSGGVYGYGTIFRITPSGIPTPLYSFNTNAIGTNPYWELVQAMDGEFYGTSNSGGPGAYGTVFKFSVNGLLNASFSTVYHLKGTNYGSASPGSLVQGNDGFFYGTTRFGGTNLSGTVFKVSTTGVLVWSVSFEAGGGYPYAGLVQGMDGNLYGTAHGHLVGDGTIFKISTNGLLTNIVILNYSVTGGHPEAGLTLGNDHNFYGTAADGGPSGVGTVFKITADGTFTRLDYFNSTNGAYPRAALLQGTDGNLYGTTTSGGLYDNGVIFKIGSDGGFVLLGSLNQTITGSYPVGKLVEGTDGTLYGTASAGGPAGFGTVFRLTTNGRFGRLVSFDKEYGTVPLCGLIMGRDGNFYGTTSDQGAYGVGSVVQITPAGTLRALAWFDGANGNAPQGELVEGSDGGFYGTTPGGGGYTAGTIFRVGVPMPTILKARRQENGPLELSWDAVAGQSYQLQHSPELDSGNWTNIGNPTLATNGAIFIQEANFSVPRDFYRLNTLP